ncbi:TonB-dependent receptor domain-containing protein [Novosphingobium sp. BL-8A]|uniref:TonB-dependent receptor domain-containing protein n=1 Tax=Novosphingobium sp. BL-8A TaxID=3127639 RepID=UPI0037570BA0
MAHAQRASLDVPALPLSSAIAELGRQAGVEILLNAPGMEGRRARGVQGTLPASIALAKLLRGLNLAARQVAPGVFVISPVQPRVQKPVGSAAPPPLVGAEILVSARRRPELDEDVPLLVIHRAPEDLQRKAVRTLADLAKITPGFVATGQTTNATPLLVMRGQRRSISDENRLPLVVYQDEVPLPNQAALTPLYDMASIEVLRGPQGTLFGRNTTSGAVLLRSVQPGSGVPSYMEAEAGNYGLFRLEGAVEPPAQGPFSLRITGQRIRREGYTHLLSGGRADNAHSEAIRAILRFAPDSPLRSTLSFDMLNANELGAASILTGVYEGGSARSPENAPYYDCGSGACDIDSYYDIQKTLGRRTSQSGIAPRFQRRFRALGNVTEYGDDKLLIRNILGWRTTQVFYALDGDGTPLAINDSTTRSALSQWTEEFQVQGRAGALRYIGGLFYLDSAPTGPFLQAVSRYVRPDNPPYTIATYQHFRSAAIFGQVTFPIAETLVADVGLRYTGEWISGCSLRSTTAEPESRRACLAEGGSAAEARSRRLTWTLALTKRLGEHSIYLTSRRAFRSGGSNSPALAGSLSPYQTFKPETLTDLELGAKGRWTLGSLTGAYTAAAYVGFYDKVQRALFPDIDYDGDGDLSTDPITLYINSAKARIAGLDGDLSANIGPRLHITLSGSWIDARYTKVIAPAALMPLLGSDPLHNRFTYMPRFSGTVSILREIPLAGTLGQLDLSADYSHVSKIRFTERSAETFGSQPGYGLLGAAIAWRGPGGLPLDIEIWGRNLTDRFYASGGGTLNPAYAAGSVITGPPRTIGIRLRYSFE